MKYLVLLLITSCSPIPEKNFYHNTFKDNLKSGHCYSTQIFEFEGTTIDYYGNKVVKILKKDTLNYQYQEVYSNILSAIIKEVPIENVADFRTEVKCPNPKIVTVDKDLEDTKDILHRIDIKLECMKELLKTDFSKVIPSPCNKDIECVRNYIDKWEENCIKGKK